MTFSRVCYEAGIISGVNFLSMCTCVIRHFQFESDCTDFVESSVRRIGTVASRSRVLLVFFVDWRSLGVNSVSEAFIELPRPSIRCVIEA